MKIAKIKTDKLSYEDLDTIAARSGWKARNQAYARLQKPSHVYVWTKDESVMENLENRKCRPYTIYKKTIMPDVLRQMGLPSFTKVRWSQKAGCGCGCSPAFIVDGHYGTDVHVTVEA